VLRDLSMVNFRSSFVGFSDFVLFIDGFYGVIVKLS